MIQSRIREIRKARGLTLQQVAGRIGTTAQTIGRLETGMRTLSIDWVERIAEALEADASELLALPESGDITVSGRISGDGKVVLAKVDIEGDVVAPRMIAKSPVAFRILENMGQYRAGDVVVCDALETADYKVRREKAEGRDCYISLASGKAVFGRVISCGSGGKVDVVPIAPAIKGGSTINTHKAQVLAPAAMLIRTL